MILVAKLVHLLLILQNANHVRHHQIILLSIVQLLQLHLIQERVVLFALLLDLLKFTRLEKIGVYQQMEVQQNQILELML